MLYNLLNDNLPDNHKRYCNFDELTPFISAIESAWVSGHNQVSIPFWMDKLGHKLVSRAIYALSKADWITSKVIKRFGVLSLNQSTLGKYLTSDEQLAFRTQARLRKYRMRLVEEVQPSNITKVGQDYLETGLDRPGFAQCANNKFSLDTQYIAKYYDAIHANALKSMVKMAEKHKSITEDPANYGIIVTELLDWHLFNPDAQFNMEANFSDQRGRAIYKGLRRVFNPIASKDARSMLIADRGIVVFANNTKQMDDIYLFIAELIGAKPTTWESKKLIGMDAYNTRDLHTLDLTDDRDRKALHENIWLERIYDRLDQVHANGYAYWDIPLEMDQTASLGQFIGLLTNDYRLLDATNVVNPNQVKDFWTVDGVSNRNAIKAIGTPASYGSSQSYTKLLKAKKEVLTKEEMKLVRKEFSQGAFGTIIKFKNLTIQNMNISTPTYEVQGWGETYTVKVTRTKVVGSELHAYSAYDTASDSTKMFLNHSTIRVPDYDRFKTFATTCIIHNLDSRVMDKAASAIQAKGEWCIAIHDAMLVMPGTAIREEFTALMEQVRTDRKPILGNYLESIGATSTKAKVALVNLLNHDYQCPQDEPLSGSMLK